MPIRTVVVSASADDDGHQAVDADAALTGSFWQAGIGGGRWTATSANANLHGNSLRALLEGTHRWFGLRGYHQQWQADPYELRTWGGRLYWFNQQSQLGVIGENKSLRIDYVNAPGSTLVEQGRFVGHGWGVFANQSLGSWQLYVSAIDYRYRTLREFLDRPFVTPAPVQGTFAPSATGVAGSDLPRLEPPSAPSGQGPGLVDALLGMNQGVADRQLNAGVGRALFKGTLYADWLASRDAVYLSTTHYYSLSFVQPIAQSMRLTLLVGTSETSGRHGQYGGVTWAWDF